MVALGHSRRTFTIRAVDAGIGIAAAAPLRSGRMGERRAGGAGGRRLRGCRAARAGPGRRHRRAQRRRRRSDEDIGHAVEPDEESPAVFEPAHWRWSTPTSPAHRFRLHHSVPLPGRHRRGPHAGARRRIGPPSTGDENCSGSSRWSLIVATEFKIRRRSIDDALSGSIDLMIAVELFVYAVVGVWAMWRLVPSKPRLEPLTIIMWGYVLSTAVSALYSQYPTLAFARAVQLVIIATVIQLLAGQGGFSSISRFLHGWVALLSVSIIVGLLYVAPTTGPQEGRFTWLSVHSVSAGSMLALSVPVLLGLWIAAGPPADAVAEVGVRLAVRRPSRLLAAHPHTWLDRRGTRRHHRDGLAVVRPKTEAGTRPRQPGHRWSAGPGIRSTGPGVPHPG